MATEQTQPQPKAFISYSWTTPGHQALVKSWADRLMADGVDVILDVYDLKEGHDKYVFMERAVNDATVTHALMMCDKVYAEKANSRKAGVGTESQIISKEVYDKVEQSKFIPIVCELDEQGNPYLPTFLKSRIWIDFSSPEAVNENWEKLVRVLYGKPLHEKPTLGNAPAYIREDSGAPSSPALAKYATFKQAILQGKPGLDVYRRDFLDACITFADALRVRARPNIESLSEKVLEDCGKLKLVRNHVVDWVLLEATAAPPDKFADVLVNFLEKLREMKSRPPELNTWNAVWFESHALFVYETFLYIVAALIKVGALAVLHEIFTSHYILPESDRYGEERFDTFGCFYAHSDLLQSILAPPGQRLYSPAAELIKRQADRVDLPFSSIIEAELLVLLMAFITPGVRWYPQTLHYTSRRSEFPLFLRATQHRHFQKLATITGIASADELRTAVTQGHERLGVNGWHNFHFNRNFWQSMNMDKLDTLK